ncbi:uncharacterized protein MAM_04976 [Metarhizium album ARSEF 1941]|uniref:Uncharacterized protein n=1 Tax=Metarhizium album (strain ARSEF 1941) TaxID=1081103 RepID=A0A0B2WUT5_METAS|nr:uncharacterized protein MAM_04976 [Metarhizium album ARSEF 1941]KHN97379.1 hypothetical protein MAM_04976 [Metarhizium album ARSEF 1941]
MDRETATAAPGIVTTTTPAPASRSPLRTINLGALTTTFTPPDDCTSLTARYYVSDEPKTYRLNYGFTCGGSEAQGVLYGRPMAKPTCFPSSFAPAFTCEFELSDMVTPYPVYSPGLVCPHGYGPSCTISRPAATPPLDAANTTSYSNRAERSIQRMLKAGETAIGCCPSGYVCDVSKPHGCVSTVQPGGHILAVVGARGVCFRSTALETMTATSDTQAVAWGPRVLVVQSTPRPGADDEPSNASPLPGVEIAVGVSIPLGLMAIAVAAWMLVSRRRKRKTAKMAAAALDGDRRDVPELGGEAVSSQARTPTDQSDASHELPGDRRYMAQELECVTKPVELGAGEDT